MEMQFAKEIIQQAFQSFGCIALFLVLPRECNPNMSLTVIIRQDLECAITNDPRLVLTFNRKLNPCAGRSGWKAVHFFQKSGCLGAVLGLLDIFIHFSQYRLSFFPRQAQHR